MEGPGRQVRRQGLAMTSKRGLSDAVTAALTFVLVSGARSAVTPASADERAAKKDLPHTVGPCADDWHARRPILGT